MERPRYDLLEYRKGREIPYLKGIRIGAEVLYIDMNTNPEVFRSAKDIARNRDLSLRMVEQALQWCKENHDLITRVLAEERKRGGLKD